MNPGIASARKYSGCWPFVSSFRHSMRWICTTYTTFHMLCHRKKILIVCQKGINQFQTLYIGFKAAETIKLCDIVPCWFDNMGFHCVDLCSNLVPFWVCNNQCVQLLQHDSFKISFVCASDAMDQMLFCCIVVFQYFSIICWCGASATAFAMHHVA